MVYWTGSEKKQERLQKEIIEVSLLMEMSETKADFERLFQNKYNKRPQLEFDFKDEKPQLPPLSDFNQKLKKGLEYNPKENKE